MLKIYHLWRKDVWKITETTHIDTFNRYISMKTLSWLTQSHRFICNLLQRYLDNVRYSEETQLRSVSKSFLAAAYPCFESSDTSKDPKRGALARPCISGTDITAVAAPSLRLWLSPSSLALRVRQLAPSRVELHPRMHHFVPPKAEYALLFNLFTQSHFLLKTC